MTPEEMAIAAEVAEKVMGWTRKVITLNRLAKEFEMKPETSFISFASFDKWDEECIVNPNMGGAYISVNLKHMERLPHYPVDISAAWTVVEKLRTLSRDGHSKIDFSIKQMDRLEGGKWVVDIDVLHEKRTLNFNDVHVFAPTAPLAICLAALKAVGHANKKD